MAYKIAENSKVCFSVGTSAVVYPAAYLPLVCKKKGGILIEINPEETALTSEADISIRERASVVLEKLIELLEDYTK